MTVLVIAPVLIPLLGAAITLLLMHHLRAQRFVTGVSALSAAGAGLALAGSVWRGDTLVYRVGDWPPPFGIVFVADLLGATLVALATLVVAASALYFVNSTEKTATYPTTWPIFLIMAAGLHGTFLTGDLFNFYVFVELMVISSVILVAISDRPLAIEAAIKYLIISAVGSTFLLLGITCQYAALGTLNLADMAVRLASGSVPPLANVGAVLLLGAFLLKAAVFPFHFWQPDAHSTAPTAVSAILSGMVVKVGVYGVIRLDRLLFPESVWIPEVLTWLGVIAMVFGALSALGATDVKRLLAYSTISQMGFILLALSWGTLAAWGAALIYLINHSLIKAALFLSTGTVVSRTKSYRFSEMGGLAATLPLSAALYLVAALALGGIPPLNGFISKFILLEAGLAMASYASILAVAAVSILTLTYMLRAWQRLFWGTSRAASKAPGDALWPPLLLVASLIALGIYAQPLVTLTGDIARTLANPQVYIAAVGLP